MILTCNVGIKIPVQIIRENDDFIAYTPALDISTCGKSLSEAKMCFDELVEIFLEETIKMGTLEEVLKEQGWKCVHKQWRPPLVVEQDLREIKLPA
ncbi:MAG: type II toxin-antitoxin system HicB family antitoxin [Candidatus Aenigmatarchaeota archaeon]